METLDKYNADFLKEYKQKLLKEHPAGILCPECKDKGRDSEMVFLAKNETILLTPRRKAVACSVCSYTAYMYVNM
jgi:hypothetical protein